MHGSLSARPDGEAFPAGEPSERERFLEAVLGASGDCLKVLDLDANLIFMSEYGQTLMEVSDFNAIAGCPWPNFWEGEGNAAARQAIATALAGGVGKFRGMANTMGGTPRCWDVMVTPILGRDGRPERLLSVSRDVTEAMLALDRLRTSEERLRLVSFELQHRIKNTLAVVQGIVRQTLRNSSSLQAAGEVLDQRLAAMGRAQGMLTEQGADGSDIHAVIQAALDLHDDTSRRFKVEGPPAWLAAQPATSLAMLLHELATNATKYGALSVPGGRVAITWTVAPDAARPDGTKALHLVWRETGGPAVVPPGRRGFGSRLIERSLASALGGTAVLRFLPEGVVCELEGVIDTARARPVG